MRNSELDAIRRVLLVCAESGAVDTTMLREAASSCDSLQLEAALQKAGIRAGVEPRALPDLVRRGLEVFKVEGGRIVPKETRYSRYRPASTLSLAEWASTDLRREASHLFAKGR